MLVVVALGGNALLRRGEPTDVGVQRANVAAAVEAIAELANEHDVVVTHGNGPQVGLLALQGEAYVAAKPDPLDVLGAETEAERGWTVAPDGQYWRRVVPATAVEAGFGTPSARALSDADVEELRELSFAPGSMGPKVEAGCRFAERTGGLAGIGALADAAAILRGERGTRIRSRTRVPA